MYLRTTYEASIKLLRNNAKRIIQMKNSNALLYEKDWLPWNDEMQFLVLPLMDL